MMKINFDKAGNWYEGMDFEGSHLVTSEKHNKDLGISSIRLSKPKTESNRVLADVRIYMENGMQVFGTLYPAKDGTGFNFGVEQRVYDKDDNTKGYADINVVVPMSIQAQVLRFATTKAVEVAVQAPTRKAPTAQEIAKAKEAKELADFAAWKRAQATPAPVVEASAELTAEEMQAMVNNM